MIRIGSFLLYFFILMLISCAEPASTNQKTIQIEPVPTISVKEKAACWESEVKDFTPSKFKSALALLEQSKYQYQVKKYEVVTPQKAFLVKRVSFLNNLRKQTEKKRIDTVTTQGIIQVHQSFIKGKKAMSGNTYPRADLEEWEFKTMDCATELMRTIEVIKEQVSWDMISKSPLSFWQKENKIYFLIPGGFYMLDEVPGLIRILKEGV